MRVKMQHSRCFFQTLQWSPGRVAELLCFYKKSVFHSTRCYSAEQKNQQAEKHKLYELINTVNQAQVPQQVQTEDLTRNQTNQALMLKEGAESKRQQVG